MVVVWIKDYYVVLCVVGYDFVDFIVMLMLYICLVQDCEIVCEIVCELMKNYLCSVVVLVK